MKRKHKGRKIYKTKEKNYYGKSPMGKFLSGALTVLLIGGIGFIGYSVAEPIINYTQHKGDDPGEEQEVTEPTEEATEPVEIPTDAQSTPGTSHVTESYSAAVIPEKAMMGTIENISYAIAAIPKDEGIVYVEVPLKVKGGKLYYASQVTGAVYSGAVQSAVTLPQIVEVIQNNGYKPAALISAFEDSILPATYPDSAYITIDDGSQWIDNDLANGGKPWMTPYSQTALDYMSAITEEIALAGFEKIVCADLKFPYFRETDLLMLDERLSRADRCMALTSAANMLNGVALNTGAAMQVEVSASDLLRGNADVLQPMLLSTNEIVVNIDVDELSAGVQTNSTLYEFSGTADEITDKCLSIISDKFSDFTVTIRVSGATRTTEELLKAKKMVTASGYDSCVIG